MHCMPIFFSHLDSLKFLVEKRGFTLLKMKMKLVSLLADLYFVLTEQRIGFRTRIVINLDI